ncbi:hypothetical protein NL676_020547 [Syzygium grande]|nr:hypothetical protein NL676_020547 [Syzygium grande]
MKSVALRSIPGLGDPVPSVLIARGYPPPVATVVRHVVTTTQVGVDVQVLASHELWVFQFIDVSLGGWLLEECWIEWMAKIDPNDIGFTGLMKLLDELRSPLINAGLHDDRPPKPIVRDQVRRLKAHRSVLGPVSVLRPTPRGSPGSENLQEKEA